FSLPHGPPGRSGSISMGTRSGKPQRQPNRSFEILAVAGKAGSHHHLQRAEEWDAGGQALGLLVPLSSSTHMPYTCGLSTSLSTRALTRLTRWETLSWSRLRA